MTCPNRNPPDVGFDPYSRRGKNIRSISSVLASIEWIRVNRRAKIWGKIETEDIFGRQTVYDRSEQDAQLIKGPGGLLTLKDTGDDAIIASGEFAFYINLFDLESGEPISGTIRWSPFISPMERPVSVDVGPLTVVYCSLFRCFHGVVSIRIVNEKEEEEEMLVTGSVRAHKIIKRGRIDGSSTTILFEDYEDGVRVLPGSKIPLPRSRVIVLAFADDGSIGSHTEIEVDLRLGGGVEVIARGSVGFWVEYRDKVLAPQSETITGPKGLKVHVTMDFIDYLPPSWDLKDQVNTTLLSFLVLNLKPPCIISSHSVSIPRSRVVVLAFYDQKSIGSHTEIEVDLRLGGGGEVIARGSVGFWVDYHDKILAPKMETISGPKGHKVRVTMDITDYLPPE